MAMLRFLCLMLIILVMALSCQSSHQEAPEPIQYSVPAELEPLLAAFRLAASEHHNPVSTANLIVTFGPVQSQDVCGQCQLEAGKTPRIVLNNDAFCWQQASADERECLLFHELGHCLLQQAHRGERFASGAYKSLMNPDDVGVYATCRYPIGGDVCDKRSRRAYYLNELFDPSTPIPAWAQ